MRRRVTVVVLSVCLCVHVSVKSHITSGVSVRPENIVTYSAGNGGLFSETTSLLRPSTASVKAICTVGHFLQKALMRIICGRQLGASGRGKAGYIYVLL